LSKSALAVCSITTRLFSCNQK